MSQENPNAFKHLISEDVVKKYFKTTKLKPKEVQKIIQNLKILELKPRVKLIATELQKNLPPRFPEALHELETIVRKQKLKSFELWPATEFIQTYGIDHIDESLAALYKMTQKFTAEFSIRPFINKYGDEIYQKLSKWSNDPNEHIRRWISEGTRPRLPWGERLPQAIQNPIRGLEILESLKHDSSLYVRKSVANHLNDIAKDHPEIVVQTLLRWKKEIIKAQEKDFHFLSSRALRTLVKEGHSGALKFMGVTLQKELIRCSPLKLRKAKIKMDEKLDFEFSIQNTTTKKLKFIVDFVIFFQKSNGELSAKVFKLKTGFLNSKQKIEMRKSYHFKPITTRRYYSGKHQIALKINGHLMNVKNFELKV
jgi:3-methyladenine DNA glycosylase AlkC